MKNYIKYLGYRNKGRTQKLSATPKISVDEHGLLLAVKSSSLTKASSAHTPNLCAVFFAF